MANTTILEALTVQKNRVPQFVKTDSFKRNPSLNKKTKHKSNLTKTKSKNVSNFWFSKHPHGNEKLKIGSTETSKLPTSSQALSSPLSANFDKKRTEWTEKLGRKQKKRLFTVISMGNTNTITYSLAEKAVKDSATQVFKKKLQKVSQSPNMVFTEVTTYCLKDAPIHQKKKNP